MPVRVEDLTSDVGMGFEIPVLPATAEKAVVLPDSGLTLRKLDLDQTKFDASGKYYETIVALPNWVAEGLTELFGFETVQSVEPVIQNQDPLTLPSVTYQLSVDGGTTWLVWVDGPDAWLPAVGLYAGVFNDEETVDRRIPLLPFGDPRQVRFQVKLTPGLGGIQRPILTYMTIYNKHRMDLYEDVTRSLKRYIDANIKVPMFFFAEVASPSTTVVVEREPGLDVTITPPIKVYNTTTDPGKNINLFSFLDPDGRTIHMVGPQVGQIEVQFTGVPEVFVGAEDFIQISKIPSIVAIVTQMTQYLDVRHRAPESERSLSRMEGRLQFTRLYYKIQASVKSQSALKREALQMTDAVARILDQGQCFNSVANGECYCVFQQKAEVAEDRIAQGLFVGSVNLEILGKVWLTDEITDESNLPLIDRKIPLVRTPVVSVGAENSCNLNLPPHRRRVYRENFNVEP